MNIRSSSTLPSRLLLLAAAAAWLLLTSCSEGQAASDGPGDGSPSATAPAQDKPLADWQGKLLDVAAKTATAIPVEPHLKDRSKAQEAVVAACLELDQPQRALAVAETIANWRRGTACAAIAVWQGGHGQAAEAQRLLDLAVKVSESAEAGASEDEPTQGWRRDRVRAAIAKAWLQLGHPDKAEAFVSGVEDAEAAELAAVKAQFLDASSFDAQLAELDAAVADGGFDRIHAALQTCTKLFDRFYADEAQRTRAEEKLKAGWKKLPVKIGIDLMEQLAGSALAHEDRVKGLALVNELQALVDGQGWLPEDGVPLQARLAVLRFRAGEADAAHRQLDAALARYDAERMRIANIFRAEALRPVAEAWQALGDSSTARSVYRKVVEEGFENPNSRPRAEDLSATCLSMAAHAVEPDAALSDRIEKMAAALGAPW